LARLPSAWAKARTCAGLTTTTGKPALATPAATLSQSRRSPRSPPALATSSSASRPTHRYLHLCG
jgi:hypothetical protein